MNPSFNKHQLRAYYQEADQQRVASGGGRHKQIIPIKCGKYDGGGPLESQENLWQSEKAFLKEMLTQARRVLQAEWGAQARAERPSNSLACEEHSMAVMEHTWEAAYGKR